MTIGFLFPHEHRGLRLLTGGITLSLAAARDEGSEHRGHSWLQGKDKLHLFKLLHSQKTPGGLEVPTAASAPEIKPLMDANTIIINIMNFFLR